MENNESISITNQSYCKAYIASEIIDLIPIDYCIPTRFEEGWAITFADGTLASTESSTYYDSQVDAAISFLLFLLKNNIK